MKKEQNKEQSKDLKESVINTEEFNFEAFAACVEKMIQDKCKDERKVVRQNVVRKNNGVQLVGLTIMEEEGNISPTIYLEQFYELYQGGMAITEIVEKILKVYKDNQGVSNYDMSFFENYNLVKEHIVYKLVNIQKNQELLKEIPYVPYLDMAIIFYYIMQDTYFDNAHILIHNNHMKMWNVDTTQIFEDAKRNTPIMLDAQIINMMELMKESFIEKLKEEYDNFYGCSSFGPLAAEKIWNRKKELVKEKEDSAFFADLADEIAEFYFGKSQEHCMFVLTNEKRRYGAACILYDDILQKFAELKNDNVYVLPSSVHEVIIVEEGEIGCPENLQKIVRDINEREVLEEEILSDSVYYYDREKKELRILLAS